MPYINKTVLTEQDLGISFDDIGSQLTSVFKTGSDIYQLKKQQAQQMALAKLQAQTPQQVIADGRGFFEKHGLKLAIGAGGLLVVYLLLRKK